MENKEFESDNILQTVADMYSYFAPVLCFYVKVVVVVIMPFNLFGFGILLSNI